MAAPVLHARPSKWKRVNRLNRGNPLTKGLVFYVIVDGPYIPSDLVSIRNELLEERLVSMKRGRIEAEREQAESARKDLLLEIERERAAAEQAATRQRREIEIEAEPAAP